MERYKNIALAFFLLAFISLSAGIGLKAVVTNAVVASSIIATIFILIAIYFFLKAKKAEN
ncbi:MAG: hypothetical protein ACI35O_10490 [Bacillaceae bacterium]